MLKSTLLVGAFLLTGLCFGQKNFQEHTTPASITNNSTLKSDLDAILSLEKTVEMSATSSRSRGTEVRSQLQTAYKQYLSDLNLMLQTAKDDEKAQLAAERDFVTTLITP